MKKAGITTFTKTEERNSQGTSPSSNHTLGPEKILLQAQGQAKVMLWFKVFLPHYTIVLL